MRGTRRSLAFCSAALVVVLAVVLALPMVAAALGDWPSFHRDSRNAGFDPAIGGEGPPRLGDLWWDEAAVADALVEASPVLSEGVVVVADWSGIVRALEEENGAERWRFDLKDKVVGTPALWSGRAYAVDVKGQLVALDLVTGELLATATVGATLGTPTIHEGKLFIGTEDGKLKAYTAHNLDLLWTFNVATVQDQYVFNNVTNTYHCTGGKHPAGQIRGAPAVFGGAVFFGSMNHHVYAVDEQGNPDGTTSVLWTHRTGDIVTGAAAIDVPRARVLFGSWDERLYAFSATPTAAGTNTCNGLLHVPAWSFQVPSDVGASKVHSSPALDATSAYFGANNGRVYAVDLTAGAKRWEYATGGPVFSSPAVGATSLVVGSDDGHVYWISALNGSVLDSYDTGAPVKASPALAGANVFVASQAGTVYRFGPELPDRPDLVVARLAGDADGIVVTIANQGPADAGPTTATISLNGQSVTQLDIPAIAAGGQASAQHDWSLENGTHEVSAVVDPDDLIWEALEGNNERGDIIVVLPPEPAEEEPPPAPAGSDWRILAAAGALLMLALGAGAWLLIRWLRRRRGRDVEAEEAEDWAAEADEDAGDDEADWDPDAESGETGEYADQGEYQDADYADEGDAHEAHETYEEYPEHYGDETAGEYVDESDDDWAEPEPHGAGDDRDESTV